MTNHKNVEDVAVALTQFTQKLPSRAQLARIFETDDLQRARQLVSSWNASPLAERKDWPDTQSITIAVCGFSTLEYLKPHLMWATLADGIVSDVIIGQYNQLYQDLSVQSRVSQPDVEVLWVWEQLNDLLPLEVSKNADILLSDRGIDAVNAAIDSLVHAIASVRNKTGALILVNDFFSDRPSPFGIADSSREVHFEQIFRIANDRLQKGLATITHSVIFPLAGLLRDFGLERAVDRRLELLADCRFTPEFFFRISRAFRPYVRSLKAAVKKVLVLDLDNTLWGGVVGEDGWDKVKIGSEGAGKAYLIFQTAALELYNRGVILAINSKNNLDDVKELFERRQEMVLKPEHFASIRTNWQDKAKNCLEIAEEINVGLDSLVLWDDNPAERLFVRGSLNQVYVVEPPDDPADWADYLIRSGLFDSLQFSVEDATRGQMYAQDRLRRQTAAAVQDMESFLSSLELEVEVQPVSEQNIPRIVSLLSRTNQFNLTTKRHTEQTIRDWAFRSDFRITCYAAKDRFGSYGIVGVTILTRTTGATEIDSLLLSCRAMGKGIEKTMLSVIAGQTKQFGVKKIKAVYKKTKKNASIKDFLPDNGFMLIAEDGDDKHFEFDLSQKELVLPKHITIK